MANKKTSQYDALPGGIISDAFLFDIAHTGVKNYKGTKLEVAQNIIASVITGLNTTANNSLNAINELQTNAISAGMLTGGEITLGGGETIDVDSGTGYLRTTDSHTGILETISWSVSAGIAIPTDTVKYVGVDYNAGSPIVIIKSTDTWNRHTEFRLGSVVNENTILRILDNPWMVANATGHSIERFFETFPFKRADRIGGLIIGETGTRNITVTAGEIYDLTNEFTIAAIDTSGTGTFDTYLGLTLQASAQTQWDNQNYNNGGVLTALGANKWGTLWWYLEADGKLVMNYGIMEHANQAAADLEAEPPVRPVRVQVHGTLIGRTVFQKSAATADFQSAFVTQFAGGGSSDHLQLSNLTAGDAGHTQFLPLDGSKSMTGDINFVGIGNTYKFGVETGAFKIWSQIAGTPSIINLYSKDADGTDATGYRIYRVGNPDSPTPVETLEIISDTTTRQFNIIASGTSNQPNILFRAGTVNDQLLIEKDDGLTSTQKWNNNKPFDRFYRRIRGSSIVQSGDGIVEITAQGYDGTTYRDAASIKGVVAGTPGANDMPGKWEFYTTPDGSTTLKLGLTIEDENVTCEGNGAHFAPSGTAGEAPSPTGGGHRYSSTSGRNEFADGAAWVTYVKEDTPTSPSLFVAYSSGDLDNVTGDGTVYDIILNTTDANIGADYNTTTGVYTAPVTGIYEFSMIVFLDDIAGTSTNVNIRVSKGGASPATWWLEEKRASAIYIAGTGQLIINGSIDNMKCLASDPVTFKVQVDGAAKTADVRVGTIISGKLVHTL